ncbi:MAG TPA: hypothetical protein HA232_01385 [Methanocellales archaeon]|jgi:hypothetical protein|nr:hypothetical protein [Methanocellales archaeon]
MEKKPTVIAPHVFLNISRDFCRPLDAIREAISNAADANATEVCLRVWEDKKMPGGELVTEITDNGDGMDERGLEAFFNLGDSSHVGEDGTKLHLSIGEKGHGTKTYFNSRQVEVFTKQKDGCALYALMDEPLKDLLQGKVPPYEFDQNPSQSIRKGTKVVIRGFNQNVKKDFSHRVLKDYILWFTKFADFSWVFDDPEPEIRDDSVAFKTGPKILLHGLGHDEEWEHIHYGHVFPRKCTNLSELRNRNSAEPMRWYVKRWRKKGLPVKEFPNVKIDVVFSLEGDLVRRDYNTMISYQGKRLEGDYTIEQRYGLWVAKDFIPVKQANAWFSKGTSEWTKFHAFVNCQDFALTANRSDVNNTDPRLLAKIEETVTDYYEEHIEDSNEFKDYLAGVSLQEGYRSRQQELQDFNNRKKRALKKNVAKVNGVELLAPGTSARGARGQEMGVHCLFAQLTALNPDLFPFKVVDYDTHRGYDCLISHSSTFDLANPSLAFVEFKYTLDTTFNHSFENLLYVVCWDCNLNHGTEITDLTGERRILEIYPQDGQRDHTEYYLRAIGRQHNIEVYVLKKYASERLGVTFSPRTAQES